MASVDIADIRSVVTAVGDRRMEGRLPGSAGDERAEAYLARRMAEFGLQPLGEHGTYLQRVAFRQKALRPTTTFSVGGTILHWHRDFLILPNTVPESLDVRAPITYVRYGRSYTDLSVPSLSTESIRGRVVVALIRTLRRSEFMRMGAPAKLYTALANAGARAILMVNDAPDSSTPGAELPRVSIDALDGAGRRLPPILGVDNQAAARLLAVLGMDFGTERAAAERDTVVCRPLAPEGTLTIRTDVRDTAAHNVVGMIPGSDAALRGQAVVLSAHHDHLGISDNGLVFAGAVDNAMGTADVLAAARAVTRSGLRPRRSIIVLITTAEEFGLLGARYWAAHPTWPRDGIVADVNVEGDNTVYPWHARKFVHVFNADSSLARLVNGAAVALGHVPEDDPVPEQHAENRSDAAAFVRAGVPAAFVFMLPDSGVSGGRRYFSAGGVLHTPADTVRSDWNYGVMADKAKLALLSVWRVANPE